MGLFNKKHIISGLAVSLLVSSGLFAAESTMLDDKFDDDVNYFDSYWYYYDDSAGVSTNDRAQSEPDSKPSIINVKHGWEDRKAYEGDKGLKKSYTFVTGSDWKAADGGKNMSAFVGIGTELCPNGESIDLTGVTAIKFKAKTSVSRVSFNFKVQTKDIDDYSAKTPEELTECGYDAFGYYSFGETVEPGDWKNYEIPVDSLKLPTWAHDIDFDIKTCTKIAWELLSDGDGLVGIEDTFFLTDVELVGKKLRFPDPWSPPPTKRPGKGMFATFDTKDPQKTPLGTSWYAYTDAEFGGKSSISEDYAVENKETGKLSLKFIDSTGFDEKGKSAAFEYKIGPVIEEERDGKTVNIQGFVGVGCNLYDSAKCTYYNCGDSVKSIYFEYITYGDEKVTFEVSDKNDVNDKDEPDRGNKRGSGIVYYKTLLGTAGKWVRVNIPLNNLFINSTWEGYNPIPFDTKNLAKLQWKVQAGEGSEGIFAIDNVMLVGGNFGLDSTAVKFTYHNAVKAPFKAAYVNGKINISFNNSDIASGKISIVNTRGAVVKSIPVSSTRSLSTSISTDKISAGMYLVKLDAKSLNGKSVVRQTKLNIVK